MRENPRSSAGCRALRGCPDSAPRKASRFSETGPAVPNPTWLQTLSFLTPGNSYDVSVVSQQGQTKVQAKLKRRKLFLVLAKIVLPAHDFGDISFLFRFFNPPLGHVEHRKAGMCQYVVIVNF